MSLQIALLALTLAAPRQVADLVLRERVMTIVANSGAEVAVAFRTLDGRTELLLDPDKVFHAASTMKVPVMIELFRQAQAGQLSLDDPLPIRNEFHSIVDGSVYQLDVGDDSDADRLQRRREEPVVAGTVRGHDHGEQQLRREPADRAAGRREHPADRHAARSGRHAGAARR